MSVTEDNEPPAGVSERDATETVVMAALLLVVFGLHWVHDLNWNRIHPPIPISIDEKADVRRSLLLVEGDGIWPEQGHAYYQAPLYPYFLALVRRLGAQPTDTAAALTRARVIQFGLIAGASLLTLLLGRALHSLTVGLIAGMLVGFSGELLFYSRLMTKVAPVLFLTTLSLYLYVRGRQCDSRWRLACAGAALGLACLGRGNLLAVIPLFAGWLALDPGTWKQRLGRAALFAGAAALAIAPVAIRNAQQGQRVLTTWQAGSNFYSGNHALSASPGGYVPPSFIVQGPGETDGRDWRAEAERRAGRPLRDHEVSQFWMSATFERIGSNFGSWLLLLGKKLMLFWNRYDRPDLVDLQFVASESIFDPWMRLPLPRFGLLALLLPLALVALWRRPHARPLIAFAAVNWLVISMFLVNGRYRYALIPLLAVGAAMALVDGFRRVREERAAAGGIFLLLVLGAGLAFFPVERLPFADSWTDVAGVYAERGRTKRAIAAYQSAIASAESEPRRARVALTRLATMRDVMGERDEAVALLRKAIEVAPDYHAAHAELGRIYANARRFAEARDALETALRLASRLPDDSTALREIRFNIAVLLLQSRDPSVLPRVVELLTAVLRAGGPDPKVQQLLAQTLAHLGRLEDALPHLRALSTSALNRRPDTGAQVDDVWIVNHGRTLLALERTTQLEALLADIRRLRPADAAAKLIARINEKQ